MLRAKLTQLDQWVGRFANWTSVVGLLGGGAVLTGLFSFVASGWDAIASQGWGAIVLAGAFTAAFMMLSATGSLALYRYFRPLPVIYQPLPAAAVTPTGEVVAPVPPSAPIEPEVIEWMPPSWALEEFGHLDARKAKQEIEDKIQEANERLGGLEAEEYSALRRDIEKLEREKTKETWRIMWSLVHQLRNGTLIAEGFADPADKIPVRISPAEWRKYTPDETELTAKRAVTLGSVKYIGVMIGRPKDDDDIPF